MRLALLQGPAAPDVDGALAEVADAAHRAAEARAAVLVCSELTCTGYRHPLRPEPRPDAADPGPIGSAMRRIARRCGVAVVYGYVEQSTDRPYNAVAAIDSDGRLAAHYRKTHLFRPAPDDAASSPDDSVFAPGGSLVAQFTIGPITFGLLVCYDVEFPETVRAHALAGTDVVLVPTALAYPETHIATALVPVRAWESQVFVAYVNRVGQEPGPIDGQWITYTGLSCLAAPDGTMLAQAGDGPALLTVEVDIDLIASARRRTPYLRDRRTDLYPGP